MKEYCGIIRTIFLCEFSRLWQKTLQLVIIMIVIQDEPQNISVTNIPWFLKLKQKRISNQDLLTNALYERTRIRSSFFSIHLSSLQKLFYAGKKLEANFDMIFICESNEKFVRGSFFVGENWMKSRMEWNFILFPFFNWICWLFHLRKLLEWFHIRNVWL